MSEQEFLKVFAKNLKYYLQKNDLTQADLAKRLGVSATSVSNWTGATKAPRMDTIDAMCTIFKCKRSDLMEEHSSEEGYYVDPETARIAQEVFDDPELHVLFDAAKDASPEDIRKAADYLRLAKQMTLNQNDEGC